MFLGGFFAFVWQVALAFMQKIVYNQCNHRTKFLYRIFYVVTDKNEVER